MHLAELTALQTEVTRLIADFQHVTANPKTDSRLGRIGV
jgi:hypothetical protein